MAQKWSSDKSAKREFILQIMGEVLVPLPRTWAGRYTKQIVFNADGSLFIPASRLTSMEESRLRFEHRVWSSTNSAIDESILTELITASQKLLRGYLSLQLQKYLFEEEFDWRLPPEQCLRSGDYHVWSDGLKCFSRTMTVSFSRLNMNTRTGSPSCVRGCAILYLTPILS